MGLFSFFFKKSKQEQPTQEQAKQAEQVKLTEEVKTKTAKNIQKKVKQS